MEASSATPVVVRQPVRGDHAGAVVDLTGRDAGAGQLRSGGGATAVRGVLPREGRGEAAGATSSARSKGRKLEKDIMRSMNMNRPLGWPAAQQARTMSATKSMEISGSFLSF